MAPAVTLAVSNIAWRPDEDELAASILGAAGVEGLELAPTTRWAAPLDVPAHEVDTLRRWWDDRGLRVVALQSLLYGRPDLQVFGAAEARAALVGYVGGLCRLAQQLGATRLVFGSPANRRPGTLDAEARDAMAVDVFRRIGEQAHDAGVVVGLEANPASYGCEWIRSVSEAARFVRAVAHPGVGLHLDAGGMLLHGDSAEDVAAALAVPGACHVHASDPGLAAPGDGDARSRAWHATVAGLLDRAGYGGSISLEMRRDDTADRAAHLGTAVARFTDWYGAARRSRR